jgi:hypothetical protein
MRKAIKRNGGIDMRVLILICLMFVSEIAICQPMTYSVKTEHLGLPGLGNANGGGPRARVQAIRERIQARRAARQAKRDAKAAAAIAAPVAAAGQ